MNEERTILLTMKIVVKEDEQYPDGFPDDCSSFDEAVDALVGEFDNQTVELDGGIHGTFYATVIKAQVQTSPGKEAKEA
jgi:hypothetical protein